MSFFGCCLGEMRHILFIMNLSGTSVKENETMPDSHITSAVLTLNILPSENVLDKSKLKAFASDNLKIA